MAHKIRPILVITAILTGCHVHSPGQNEDWETVGMYSGGPEVGKRITNVLTSSSIPCREGDGSIHYPIDVPKREATRAKVLLITDAMHRGYWFKTKEAFDEMLRIIRTAREAYAKGEAKREQGDYPAAVAHYTEATSVAPEYVEAWVGRARAHRHVGEVALAVADYRRAIDILLRAGLGTVHVEAELRELTHH